MPVHGRTTKQSFSVAGLIEKTQVFQVSSRALLLNVSSPLQSAAPGTKHRFRLSRISLI